MRISSLVLADLLASLSLSLSLSLCACFSILHFFDIFSVGDKFTGRYMQVTCREFECEA
jgi:hypothetical protein